MRGGRGMSMVCMGDNKKARENEVEGTGYSENLDTLCIRIKEAIVPVL